MKIGELAKAAGVRKDTVRHYVEIGLLQAEKDPHNGYQLFSQASLSRLRFIKTAQRLGFRLDEVQTIFQDANTARSPCPGVREVVVQRIAETRAKVVELTALCQQMEQAVAAWQDMPNSTPDGHSVCRLIESQQLDPPAPTTGD